MFLSKVYLSGQTNIYVHVIKAGLTLMCLNGLVNLANKIMYRVYVICVNLDWNA